MPGVLASGLSLWVDALGVVLGGTGSTELIVATALTIATLLAVAIAVRLAAGGRFGVGHPAPPRAAVLRDRARRARLPRLRDPDAPGRARPRAPSMRPSAA